MTTQLDEVLVWVLIHSLWQGVGVAVVVSALLRWLPARRDAARYGVSVCGLGAIVLSVLVTWSVLTLEPRPAIVPQANVGPQSSIVESTVSKIGIGTSGPGMSRPQEPRSSRSTSGSFSVRSAYEWTPWVALLWLLGATLMLIRTVGAILMVRQWRASRVDQSPAGLEALCALQQQLCDRLQLERVVTMLLCEQVSVPTVIGAFWPCILIPPTMLTGIPLDQWRIILAHELAHIRRHDALVNLVQMVIESLLFFNPAVWWLSRLIRIEREACCDALAVRVCGQPLSVARTLVEFAASLNGDTRWATEGDPQQHESVPTIQSQVALAFTDPHQPGDLTDRVQRLVEPEAAARPRLTWTGLLIVLCSLCLVTLALQWGTKVAVHTAAQLMSPQERVAKLEKLQTETTGVYLPPEPTTPATAGPAPAVAPGSGKIEIPITVIIRTDDGTPIPKGLHIHSVYQSGNNATGSTLDNLGSDMPEYRKAFPFPPCTLRLCASAPGYASVASRILYVTPELKDRTAELILSKGTTVTLKIRDGQDEPVPNAHIRAYARLSLKGMSSGTPSSELTTNDAGVVKLDHVGEMEFDLQVRAPAFRRLGLIRHFKPSESATLELTRAIPTEFQVIDRATEKPVAQAHFVAAFLERNSGGNALGDPRRRSKDSWLDYGATNEQGRVVLNELQDGTRYTFGVMAEGYGMEIVEGVFAGQPLSVVKLKPPVTVSGHIEGDLSKLSTVSENGTGQPQRTLGYSHRINNNLQDYSHAKVDADGRFEIGDLLSGEQVTIGFPCQPVDLVVTKSITDFILKIETPTAMKPVPMRQLVLHLSGTSPNAPARGTVYVSVWHANAALRQAIEKSGELPLLGNEIRLSVPVGCVVGYQPEKLVGYRIEARSDFTIPEGQGAYVIDIPTQPAGGIHGTIVRADGTPATSGFITVFAIRLPSTEKNHSRINPSSATASSTFLASLPLGGKYRILARELNDERNVWVLSDEIELNEVHPIAEIALKLPEGRTIDLKLLDPKGVPVADQKVAINLGFSIPGGHSTSMDVNRFTRGDGVARYENMAVDAAISPLKLSLRADVAPGRFRGWQGEIDPSHTIEIRLREGRSVSGVLIEAASGKPIPKASLWLSPRDSQAGKYRGIIRTTTNREGKFEFTGLEAMEYTGNVEGTVPKGTIITPQADGELQFRYPPGVEQLKLDARSVTPVRWEVVITPRSQLKPAD